MSQLGVHQAFVLGAGLGTRLRPLTDGRPKPLVPILNKPLITFAFDHLRHAGVTRFAVNTHHRPEAYERLLGAHEGRGNYFGSSIHFAHEPILLETGGGIAHIRPQLDDQAPFFVYNGDVLSDAPLDRLIERHLSEGNVATLLLRSHGGPLQVQCDLETGLVQDIRQKLGTSSAPAFLFSGIYLLDPRIFAWIPPGEILSIIPVLLKMIEAGERVGGVVEDEGRWFDLGEKSAYVETCRSLALPENSPAYPLAWPLRAIHASAEIAEDVRLEGYTTIGARSQIGRGAVLKDCLIWDGAQVAPGARLSNCIVRDGGSASGELYGVIQ